MKRLEHQHIQHLYRAAQSGVEALCLALEQVLGVETSASLESVHGSHVDQLPEAVNDNLLPHVQGAWLQQDDYVQVAVEDAVLSLCFTSPKVAARNVARPDFLRLLPHVRQAYSLALRFERTQQKFWWSQSLVTQLPMPVWIFDTEMNVVIENSAAQRWLREAPIGMPAASMHNETWQQLCALVAPVWSDMLTMPEASQCVTTALEFPHNQCWMQVRRLSRGKRIARHSAPLLHAIRQDLCLVRVMQWQASTEQLSALQQHWQLTPSERVIVGLLLEGKCIKHIAQMRQTAEVTVRKQVKTLMRKAGVGSQEQLIIQLCDHLLTDWNLEIRH